MPETQARDVAGHRYATAVMEMAREDNSFESWDRALDVLASLTQQSAFVNALQGDGMTDERFQETVRRVVPDIRQPEMNLFRLLRRKGRLALGPSIYSYFRELWDEEQGVERATVRTAIPLSEDAQRALARRLAEQTGKTVQLDNEVDPSLIAGAVIRIGDRLVDGSTRTRLRQLRERLLQGAG